MFLKFIPYCLILLAFCIPNDLSGQAPIRKCHTMEADAHLRAQYPEMGTLDAFENWLAPKVRSFDKNGGGRAISVIPIVFHIIHNGESIGTGDNLSATYINAQIQQLNNDFRRILGSSGYNTSPVGADVEIEFCPALTDPEGNLLTEAGINRIDRNVKGWAAPPYGGCINDNFDETYIETTIKPQSQWDPDRYLNVWVMDVDCSILGYAQFPNSSGLSGFSSNNGPSVTDGVVLLNTSLGSTEIPFPDGNIYNMGRTATHEIGHFFGLRHIWGDQTCGNDFCADTPEAEGPARGCPNSTTCDDQQDMVENYMDYSNDACMNIFTADQRARMQTVLLNSPRRGTLANSTACSSSNGNNGLNCRAIISSFPYNEDFETSFGDWFQSGVDDFDWIRNSGATPSNSTGPGGAAVGSWYVFMEASAPNYPNKTSILNSPCFDLSTQTTASFSFQYHQYGAPEMGQLELQIQTGNNNWTQLWSVSENQGNAWQTVSLDLSTFLGDTIQLRFFGTTGITWQGDMAIDNLSLNTGEITSTCVSSISTFPYQESWENDFGAWSQDNQDNFDWIRNSGPTPSGNTGPSSAIDGSWYAYIESSSPNYSNLSAILNGPCYDLSAATEATFSFQYHLYGANNMGGLRLEARSNGGNWENIWSLSGNAGNSWQQTSIDLSNFLGGSVELRIIGTTGTTWQGDMGIDNLTLSTGGGAPVSCTDIQLSITFDNYPEETSWEIKDATGTVVANGGPYTNQPDGSTLNLTGCFPNGCYSLVMKDAYGDGMCCTYGNGSYSFTDADGNVLASGSAFGASETTDFCLPNSSRQRKVTTSRNTTSRKVLHTFPNPVGNQLNFIYESKAPAEVHWQIIDLLGRSLQSASWQVDAGENIQQISVEQLPAGSYMLVVEHNGNPHTQRFIVNR